MHSSNVDDLLILTILGGLLLSVGNLVVALVNSRSSQLAELRASSNIRELYDRTYKRTRRLVSITRSGKVERRAPPSGGAR